MLGDYGHNWLDLVIVKSPCSVPMICRNDEMQTNTSAQRSFTPPFSPTCHAESQALQKSLHFSSSRVRDETLTPSCPSLMFLYLLLG